MNDQSANPPYFDGLLRSLSRSDDRAAAAFHRHVHWGYWDEPPQTACSPEQYDAAADALCRMMCDLAAVRDGMRIVDVGCGFGGTIASLNERFSNLTLVGVNIDARQLRRAAELAPLRDGNSIEWVRADAAEIPLPTASCDAVLAVESVFHFDRPRFFAEARRLLTSDGTLTLSDFVPSERAMEYLDAIDLSADEGVRQSYGQIDLSYSLDRYRALAAAHGLELRTAIDVTKNTLPTYAFLYSSTREWPDAREVELFTKATRRLEKACRSGLMGYLILQFAVETSDASPADG
ncbi:MAG: methyltransferase domain-containing protein [Planctomycetales bacterium]|nr:methyltransferase domain-containing protein [Planctomycetales bacterium]